MPVKILKKQRVKTAPKSNVKATSTAVKPKPQTKQKTDTTKSKTPTYPNVVPFEHRGAFFSGR